MMECTQDMSIYEHEKLFACNAEPGANFITYNCSALLRYILCGKYPPIVNY